MASPNHAPPQAQVAEGTTTPPAMSHEPTLKRRRVAKACRNCRQQKAKCDGRQPICNRCEGYGHPCSWPEDRRRRSQEPDSTGRYSSSESTPASISNSSMSNAVYLYDKILQGVRPKLSRHDGAALDLTLSHIRSQLPDDVLKFLKTKSHAGHGDYPEPETLSDTKRPSTEGQSYVGQASDAWVFNAIREILHEGEPHQDPLENAIHSYDRGTPPLDQGAPPELPTKIAADTYIEIYFSTIHIAYPFVNGPSFQVQYEKFWTDGPVASDARDPWLSLLYSMFAIGAYYSSFPRSRDTKSETHLGYFEQSMALGESIRADCTVANVQALLAQCFFLLATGQIDRCWKILGLAIRVGQSVGLHVDDQQKRPVAHTDSEQQETRRRMWYSMYVLDRLVALQLGRPAAIHEDDYCVQLPSKSRGPESREGQTSSRFFNDDPSTIEYFLSVIRFSAILGKVINDLYSPSQVELHPDEMLLRTTSLDEKLAEWKTDLARHLRFDLGHTFEHSLIFKRQRNMLAIKFYHLRALIHRPYLCLALLQRHNRPLMALLQRAQHQVEQFQRICVLEAQNIAHRLHNVTDERSLVHDFPWWQMISCLICASSILLVASAYIESDPVNTELQSQTLHEDAETCLKVFDVLSTNSDAARRARDMMNALKTSRILTQYQAPLSIEVPFMNVPGMDNTLNLQISTGLSKESTRHPPNYNAGQDLATWHTLHPWPGELSDAMMWSAQFLDHTKVVHDDGVSGSTLDVLKYNPAEGSGSHSDIS